MDHNSGPRNTVLPSRISGIDVQHLRYAVAAADHGSFRRAAEALVLRQSTLSRSIRQLEEHIGMTVFSRSSGDVRATEAGRDLLRMARSIVEQIDKLLTTAHSTSCGESGRLAIGFYRSVSTGNLRVTLVVYAQRFPQIDVGMIESSRTRLVATLQHPAGRARS
jgi:DNA-binding transcriptional LysR family regulator